MTKEASTSGLGRQAGTVSSATFLSRICGLVRDLLFAALLGAGFHADAFFVAFRIPNLLRDLFAEGALSSSFVPTFTQVRVRGSQEKAWALANLTLGALLSVLGVLTLLGIIFAPTVVAVIAPGFGGIEGKSELTVLLTRIMFPFLPLVAVSALMMGMLNVHEEFAIPALAPVMFNVTAILFGVVLWAGGFGAQTAVIGWSVGTLLGGLSQAALQWPKLRQLGWRLRPTLRGWRRDEGLGRIGRLMVPAVIGLSGTQVNILVNTILASLLTQGSPSWLNYAFRLMQLPIGVFGVAIAVVTLSVSSRHAAENRDDAFRESLASALNLTFLLTIPCAVGLFVLDVPIIRLIFERGAFTSKDTLATAQALSFYAVGLPAYAAVKVLAPAFYARKDAVVPMIASFAGVAVNLAFNLTFYRTLGHWGLALGTSLGAICNFATLAVAFHRRHLPLPFAAIAERAGLVILASGVMAYVAYIVSKRLDGILPGLAGSIIETLLPIVAAVPVYFGILWLCRIHEARIAAEFIRAAWRRLRYR